jgi:GDP-L-fucose synthase
MYIAGINGMVGSAIAIEAKSQGYDVIGKSSTDLDLTDRKSVFDEMNEYNPDTLVIAAAKVGGIGANSNLPVDFLSINLQIQTNLLDAAHHAEIERVLFLGSSCIYPRLAPQPILESSLLTGQLEPTNEPYAIAKIAGLKLVDAYRRQFGHNWISAMPTNLYGPRDNFNLQTAHVLPALLHRFHIAKLNGSKSVNIWGDGSPLREFLHVEDLARACLLLLSTYEEATPINIGYGQEISIRDLAQLISNVVGFEGDITFNSSMPNGTPRKFLDSTRMKKLGWEPQHSLTTGIATTYDWFVANNQEGSSL